MWGCEAGSPALLNQVTFRVNNRPQNFLWRTPAINCFTQISFGPEAHNVHQTATPRETSPRRIRFHPGMAAEDEAAPSRASVSEVEPTGGLQARRFGKVAGPTFGQSKIGPARTNVLGIPNRE